MRLDRNNRELNPDGKGKYAVLKLRPSGTPIPQECLDAAKLLEKSGFLSFGTKPGEEFFVIMLRDKYAAPALRAYGEAADADGETMYGSDVLALASFSSEHPDKKKPD